MQLVNKPQRTSSNKIPTTYSFYFLLSSHLNAIAVIRKITYSALEQPPSRLDQLIGEYGLGGELFGEYVLVDVGRQRSDWVLLNAYDLKQTCHIGFSWLCET